MPSSGEVRLYHVESGDDPLTVLLHAFPEFWFVAAAASGIGLRRFRVVAPDYQPGGEARELRGAGGRRGEPALDCAAGSLDRLPGACDHPLGVGKHQRSLDLEGELPGVLGRVEGAFCLGVADGGLELEE